MPTETKIEWCDFSSNPIRARRRDNGKGHWACVKVSPGCLHCYAETINKRFGTGLDYAAQSMKLVEPYLDEREMDRLMKSRKLAGKRVFIGDMTDIFGEWVKDAWLDKLFGMFDDRPDVTWIILTKRAERMRRYFSGPPAPNVWLGVSVEDQATADERIPLLLDTPAAVRFVSAEPLLGPIDFTDIVMREGKNKTHLDVLDCCEVALYKDEPGVLPRLDWVIVGGESGPGARPCNTEWIEGVVWRCRQEKVPVFVKQLGSRSISEPQRHRGTEGAEEEKAINGSGRSLCLCASVVKFKDPKGGDMAEWPEHLRVREFPAVKETA